MPRITFDGEGRPRSGPPHRRRNMTRSTHPHRPSTLTDRVAAIDRTALAAELDEHGSAPVGRLLTPEVCRGIAALYGDDERFRATIDMARYRFGSGRYRYFTHELPAPVRELREAFYPLLLPIARAWADKLGRDAPWPDSLEEWIARCHAAGQDKSAEILLRYGPGDWNALHQDVFGELVFPLQVVVGLDAPGRDFTGGEFLMTEQRPRAQSRRRPPPWSRGTRWSSPPGTGPSPPGAAGPRGPCGTE
ncbi:prolyl 4-hydroxylase [Streptomyces clavuligerus]|uniref:Proline hydroxylase n=1 Tax=Streptomyces clavuligerus TaxID=1901 RepID=B5GVK5_STRCL|nr:prolyl 4-hydroxylase [Streptomyces clavuligerus]AXU11722.1 prolyl 4-hydroxylase [Streptomyces clavuligerus]EDY50351.1 conserved hypothetical protein [Streptomyces clavuligerus]EFG10354.1 Conserved hypothetical protein [Streptomyces clavuligerus]QCS04503.1 prolyl 4-hydroxylase [Streptomyces clavuligerus]